MPFGDRTGPRGKGPMTGRGAGYCGGFGLPGFANPLPRRRWFGFGWRRGYRNRYAYGPPVVQPGYAYPYYYGRGYPDYGYRYVHPRAF